MKSFFARKGKFRKDNSEKLKDLEQSSLGSDPRLEFVLNDSSKDDSLDDIDKFLEKHVGDSTSTKNTQKSAESSEAATKSVDKLLENLLSSQGSQEKEEISIKSFDTTLNVDFEDDENEIAKTYEKYHGRKFPHNYVLDSSESQRVTETVDKVIAKAVKFSPSDPNSDLQVVAKAWKLANSSRKKHIDHKQLANLEFDQFSCGYWGTRAQEKLSLMVMSHLKNCKKDQTAQFRKLLRFWELNFLSLYVLAPEVASVLVAEDLCIAHSEAYKELVKTADYGRLLAGKDLEKYQIKEMDKRGEKEKINVLDNLFDDEDDVDLSVDGKIGKHDNKPTHKHNKPNKRKSEKANEAPTTNAAAIFSDDSEEDTSQKPLKRRKFPGEFHSLKKPNKTIYRA